MYLYKDLPQWTVADEKRKLEIMVEAGIVDNSEQDVVRAIIEFTQKYQSAYLPITELYKYIYQFGIKVNNNSLKSENTITSLIKNVYTSLNRKKLCYAESKNDKVSAIILLDPANTALEQLLIFLPKLKREYIACDSDAAKPFPNSSVLPKVNGIQRYIQKININELEENKYKEISSKSLIAVIALGNAADIIVISNDLPDLYQKALTKLKKIVLGSGELSALILMKMKHLFPYLATVSSAEELFTSSREPKYWHSMANEILNYAGNSDILKSLIQASTIVKYIVLTQGEMSNKAEHDDKAMDVLMQILKSYKAAFSRTQLLQFREKHSYFKMYSETDYIDIINRFVEKYGTYTKDNLPILIPVNISGTRKYIYRDYFFQIFFDKLESISYKINKEINDKLADKSLKFYLDPVCQDRDSYNRYFDEFFKKEGDFLIEIFKNPSFLNDLLIYNTGKNIELNLKRDRFFTYPSSLEISPVSEILSGDFEKTKKEALKYSPYSGGFSIIDFILDIFKIFGKRMGKAIDSQMDERKKISDSLHKPAQNKIKDEEPAPDKKLPPKKSPKEDKSKVVIKTLQEYEKELCEGRDVQSALNYYEEKWNHLLNNDARHEFVKVLNSRIISRSRFLKVPTPDIIRKETGDLLTTEDIFKNVRDKESLKNYILIAMTHMFLKDNSKK